MMTKTRAMTAQIPSTLGTPAYGCAPRTAADLGLGLGSFPGTPAWRPPIT